MADIKMTSQRVRIVEVGPRDGLQNESRPISTDDKVHLIDLLSKVGFDEIEVSSFVSPKWVPQLADAEDVFARITRQEGVRYAALVPNIRGFERALQARPDRIAVFSGATDSFCERNVGCGIEQTYQRFEPVIAAAKAHGIPIRGYVSVAFWCPYEGKTPPEQVARVVQKLLAMGCEEISLGDTIGKARPSEVLELLQALEGVVPKDVLAMHFHDTFGNASDNIRASFEQGIRIFDGSVGGLGGCPYAGPGAPGNIATHVIAETIASMGGELGLDLEALDKARTFIMGVLAGAPGTSAQHKD